MGQFIAPKATTTQRLTIIPDQGELLFDTTTNKLYGGDGTTTGGFLIGNGDVSGPSSAVNNRVVFFDGPTGKLIKDSGLTLSGTNTGDQTITLTGDVTGSGTGSFAASISAGSVTLAKMANLSANSIIGNNTGSAATPIALSGTNVTAMLDAFSSTLKGLAPASGGGTTNFLRADGTWAAPPSGGGTVTSITTSSPLTGGTITSSGTIGITQASDFQSGFVSASDYRQMAKISSSIGSISLNSAGNNARIGTSNLSSQKNLTITVYDEDAIKITTDVSSGPTVIDIAPGYAPGITSTLLNYNGELFLSLTGISTGTPPSISILSNNLDLNAIGDISIYASSFKYSNGTNYVGFQLPTLTADSLYTLPVAKPTSNKVLQSDSAGVMTWITPSSGTVTSVDALTLGTSGTDLSSTVANGTTTPVITLNVPTASATNRGALSPTDWSTFNGKQNALSGTGFVKISGTTISYDNSTYLTSISGITAGGDLTGTYPNPTIASSSVTLAKMSNLAANSIIGNNTGSAATPLALTGTQVTAMLDLFSTTTTTKGLVRGSNNLGATYYLDATGTWSIPSGGGGGGMAIGGSITSATAGSILFAGTSGVLAQDNTNFFWDNTNKRLGIGTASPTTTLDVRGAFNFLNTGALTSTLQDIGTYTINSSGTTAVGFGMRLLFQGRVNTSDSQPFGYISPYIRYYSALPSSWGTGMNFGIYNNGGYVNVLNITGNLGGELTATNLTLSGGNFYASSNSLSHATQVIGGFNNSNNSAINYATTNGGSLFAAQGVFGLVTVSAGNTSIRLHNTNGVVFTAGNGASHIARAAIQIQNLNNTAGAESGDLVFFTQNGGTAISEKIRIFAGGNVGIGTGNSNSGYKFDVNGTARFQNDVTISDTRNFIFSSTTGTKIGTATGQKLAFWNKTPIAQPTTASLSSTFTANTGTTVNDASTFGGYTLKQIAQALIDIGILA